MAVDQLGMRQGAVAVYLDAWHRDLPEFLQQRTNNGDDRIKACLLYTSCLHESDIVFAIILTKFIKIDMMVLTSKQKEDVYKRQIYRTGRG